MDQEIRYCELDGRRIAYRYRAPATGSPTVIFLPGYASDMAGGKASALNDGIALAVTVGDEPCTSRHAHT